MSENLVDGMDSGAVSEKVKRQVFVHGIGICAAPDCSNRLMQNRTTLGECAHIIPRKVGSHPREDYSTPLEDRKLEPNLIYLCLKHHKVVDDKEHADLFTADELRKWKRDHETWAAGITKSSPYLPQESKDFLNKIGAQIAQQINVSETIIRRLLDTCRSLLNRQLINEARVFLSQIDVLLLDVDSSSLNAEADLLNAILSIRTEHIPEAKVQLLQIIQSHLNNVEAMLEYIELCENAPEPDDEAAKIEKLARGLASDHPRLKLIELARKHKNREVTDIVDMSIDWTDDVWLNTRFIRQYALICDAAHKISQRDDLINRWEKELPHSPRPHVFRVLFKVYDFIRSPIKEPDKQTKQILETRNFLNQEREAATKKDPIKLRDQISLLLQELKLALAYSGVSGVEQDLKAIHDAIGILMEQCYFDSFMNAILPEYLSSLRIEPNQWRMITRKTQESNVVPSPKVIEHLFIQALQHNELLTDLDRLLQKYSYDELRQILQGVTDRDVQGVARKVNAKKDPMFALLLLESIPDHELNASLTQLLEVNDYHRIDLSIAQIKAFLLNDQDQEALELIAELQIDKLAPYALHGIASTAYRNKKWHLFIPPASRLLDFDIPKSLRTQLHGELASAYYQLGDHSNAIIHAESALSHSDVLHEEEASTILQILGMSLLMKSLPDEACKKFKDYEQISRSFDLLLQEAELYLRSGLPKKYEKALSLILQAFEEIDVYEDEVYLSALTSLVELDNAGTIPHQNEPSIEDGLFVKLDGFSNGWFYVGEDGPALGAKQIKPGTDNYYTIIHKTISDELEWPADRFSTPENKRRILHIVTAPAYLSHRAHEAMQNMANIGDAPFWMIHIPKEDGSINMRNLEQFFEEYIQSDGGFFEKYVDAPMPFSFLCQTEGGLAQAIGRISAERKGLIRCNDGTKADLDRQEIVANETLQGTSCFMDGLSALVLAEARLLEKIVDAVPNLGVSTSVIKLLRKMAFDLDSVSSSIGRGAFVDGSFEFHPRNKEREQAFKDVLVQSADLLDRLPNKVIGKTYQGLDNDRNLDNMLPDYFVDAFRYSQEQGVHLLTDDAMLLQAYQHMGESSMPRHFSSFSLVRAMLKTSQITWEPYLKFFALISGYRYHFLPVSVDDMTKAVFTPSAVGLETLAPRNITYFNFPITLSREYGVDDKTTIGLLSAFINKLIHDNTVPPEIADEVFAVTIMQGLVGRDKKMMARALFQICSKSMLDKPLVSQKSEQKLEILRNQLNAFAQGVDPIIVESSLLLRGSGTGSHT